MSNMCAQIKFRPKTSKPTPDLFKEEEAPTTSVFSSVALPIRTQKFHFKAPASKTNGTIASNKGPVGVVAEQVPPQAKPVFKRFSFFPSRKTVSFAIEADNQEEEVHCNQSLITPSSAPRVRFQFGVNSVKEATKESVKEPAKEPARVNHAPVELTREGEEEEEPQKKPRLSFRKAKCLAAKQAAQSVPIIRESSGPLTFHANAVSGQAPVVPKLTSVVLSETASIRTLIVSGQEPVVSSTAHSSVSRETGNSANHTTLSFAGGEDVKFHSKLLERPCLEKVEEIMSRDTLFPSRRKRKLLEDSHGANALKEHMYSSVLTGLGFEVPPKVNEHSYGNFIQALTNQVYKYPLVVNPDKCRIARPRTVDHISQSMDETVVMFPVTPDYASRFLWESKTYRILNTLYQHLFPDKDVLEVKVAPCVNGDRCEGVAGGIPAPGLYEEDGTPFRGRVLMAFCDPSVNVELEHPKAAGNMCFLCYLSAVMNAAIIRRCQDYDFLRDRVDPIVQFFTPTGPGNYNPITAIYPHENRPIGLFGPIIMYLPARFSWEYDPTRGYRINQRYFVCRQLDSSLMLAESNPDNTGGIRSGVLGDGRRRLANDKPANAGIANEPTEEPREESNGNNKNKKKKKKKSAQTIASDTLNNGQLKK